MNSVLWCILFLTSAHPYIKSTPPNLCARPCEYPVWLIVGYWSTRPICRPWSQNEPSPFKESAEARNRNTTSLSETNRTAFQEQTFAQTYLTVFIWHWKNLSRDMITQKKMLLAAAVYLPLNVQCLCMYIHYMIILIQNILYTIYISILI